MSDPLLPCPFCGSEMRRSLQLIKHPPRDDGECPISDLAFPLESIAAWNTRHSDPDELREALAETHNDRAALIDALEAIKEFADADETQLCWKTANDALTALSRNVGDAP